MQDKQLFLNNLPFLIPLAIVELVLLISALISILRHRHYRHGNRIIWIVLVLLIQPLGAIAYFLIGRENE
ncbi:PLDc_N domain-containing protein [Oenococcus sp. UCMA 17063]|nr:PLDc_N domain-containing protein [Oenococcus sp. UCMA 17063]